MPRAPARRRAEQLLTLTRTHCPLQLADSRPALGTNLYNVEWDAEEQSTLEVRGR